MSYPEIGGTHHRADAAGPAAQTVAAFAASMRRLLGAEATETCHPASGFTWVWADPAGGVWTLRAGGLIDPEPYLQCPRGVWRFQIEVLTEVGFLSAMIMSGGGLPQAAADRAEAGRELVATH